MGLLLVIQVSVQSLLPREAFLTTYPSPCLSLLTELTISDTFVYFRLSRLLKYKLYKGNFIRVVIALSLVLRIVLCHKEQMFNE